MHKGSIVHNESSLFFTDFCNNFETIILTNYLFHYYIIFFNQNLSKQIFYQEIYEYLKNLQNYKFYKFIIKLLNLLSIFELQIIFFKLFNSITAIIVLIDANLFSFQINFVINFKKHFNILIFLIKDSFKLPLLFDFTIIFRNFETLVP